MCIRDSTVTVSYDGFDPNEKTEFYSMEDECEKIEQEIRTKYGGRIKACLLYTSLLQKLSCIMMFAQHCVSCSGLDLNVERHKFIVHFLTDRQKRFALSLIHI